MEISFAEWRTEGEHEDAAEIDRWSKTLIPDTWRYARRRKRVTFCAMALRARSPSRAHHVGRVVVARSRRQSCFSFRSTRLPGFVVRGLTRNTRGAASGAALTSASLTALARRSASWRR